MRCRSLKILVLLLLSIICLPAAVDGSKTIKHQGPLNAKQLNRLLHKLEGPALRKRRAAVKQIGSLMRSQQKELMGRVEALLNKEHWQTQIYAARALAAIGQEAAPLVPNLIKRMKQAVVDRDPTLFDLLGETVVAIMSGSDSDGNKEILELMRTAMKSGDEKLFNTLVSSLTASGKDSVPRLVKLLKHDQASLRRQAVLTLRSLGSQAHSAIDALLACAAQHAELRDAVHQTLQAVKKKNRAPTATDVTLRCFEGRSATLDIHINDVDDLPQRLKASVKDQPKQGEMKRRGQTQFVYTVKPGYVGSDTVTLNISDGHDEGKPVTVSINVVKDTVPPQLDSAQGYGPRGVRVVFDEPVTQASAAKAGAYSIAGTAVTKVDVANDGRSAILHTKSALKDKQSYTLQVQGLTDRSKAANTGSASISFTFTADIPGIHYKVYHTRDHKDFERGPETKQKVAKKGVSKKITHKLAERSSYYAMIFEGFIQIDEAGQYTFYTASDDGSHLFINGKRVVNNGGYHGTVEKKGAIQLEPGRHRIAVTFFQGSGGHDLKAMWQGPGIKKQEIPGSVLFHRP